MTMKVFTLLSLVASASAFAPVAQQGNSLQLDASMSDMAGNTKPIQNFDPLGLSSLGSDETLAWFRAAELKHGRVAMLAFSGYVVQANGVHFPGMLSSDVSFDSLSAMKPFDAWDAVPDSGKAQILGTIFLAELYSESQGTHYMKGGNTPEVVFPKFDFSGVDADVLKVKKDRELNNGRLAMIGIMSFIAASSTPGSVPALNGLDMF